VSRPVSNTSRCCILSVVRPGFSKNAAGLAHNEVVVRISYDQHIFPLNMYESVQIRVTSTPMFSRNTSVLGVPTDYQ